MPAIVGAAHGIAGRAGEIAAVGNFNYSEAAMLFVVLAEAAVVRAAIMGGSTKLQRHFGRLVVIADIFVILHICGNQYFLKPVLGTVFEHENPAILKHDFGIYPSQAFGAEADSKIIIGIISFGHGYLG